MRFILGQITVIVCKVNLARHKLQNAATVHGFVVNRIKHK